MRNACMKLYTYTHTVPFELENGQSLPGLTLAYHTSRRHLLPEGQPDPAQRVVWICHALTANSNPQEWWDTLVGPGLFFDTTRDFIVCVNMLGSCYGSTNPTSPHSGFAHYLDFPLITIRDIVRANMLVRDHLGIDRIHLMVGGSSGGFQAVEWAIMEPERIQNLCLLATNARVSPWCTAFNESQRMALWADPTFAAQESPAGGRAGLEAARSVALISYRSYEGYDQTQAEADPDCLLASRACSYQRYQGQKLSARFNAYAYYCLSRSVDTHNVGRGRGGVAEALSRIRARTLVLPLSTDGLFPPQESLYMARHIPGAELRMLESRFGHDGFLLEYKQIAQYIQEICKY